MAIFSQGTLRAAEHTIVVLDNEFVPAATNIVVGDTVTWSFQGANLHSSTSETGEWDSGLRVTGEEFSFRFAEAGAFTYISQLFPTMRGTITVGASTSNQPPTVTIESPASGASFNPGDFVNVAVAAEDPENLIAQVVLSITHGGQTTTQTNTSAQGPYLFTIPNVEAGAYQFTATVRDSEGLSATSGAVAISVSGGPGPANPPFITSIQNSGPNQFQLTVETTSTAPHQILASPSLQPGTFEVIGTVTPTGPTFTFTDSNPPAGRRYYRVVIPGAGGNQSPVVSITSPAANAAFTAGATVTVQTVATDPDDSVSSVVLTVTAPNNQTFSITNAANQNTFTITNVVAGAYSITATARDTVGATGTSTAVAFTVTAGQPGTAPNIESIVRQADGSVQLRIRTSNAGAHRIQASSTLLPGSWSDIGSPSANGGLIEFTDNSAGTAPRRFYRVMAP